MYFCFCLNDAKVLVLREWSEPAACSAVCCSQNWTCEFHPSFAGTTDYSLLHTPGYFGATGDCREYFANYQTSHWVWWESLLTIWDKIYFPPRPPVIKQKMAIKFAVQGVTPDQLGPGLVGRAPTLDTVSHLTISLSRLNISYLNVNFLLLCKKSECSSDFQSCMIRRQVVVLTGGSNCSDRERWNIIFFGGSLVVLEGTYQLWIGAPVYIAEHVESLSSKDISYNDLRLENSQISITDTSSTAI